MGARTPHPVLGTAPPPHHGEDRRTTADLEAEGPEHPFAPYVRTLGRGPGRSRALTREEARDALGMVLRGEADPHQIGAFLMLDRKSTRLNSSHANISYAVFCLKKKKQKKRIRRRTTV